MNTIVTHMSPDVDAICAIWLVKRYMAGFSKAQIVFVPAGKTYSDKSPDQNPEVLHLDTGFGKFDHHQTSEMICAASLVFDFLKEKAGLTKNESEVIGRLIKEVRSIDHFQQVYYKDAVSDKYEFSLESILDGLKLLNPRDDLKITETGLLLFDAIFKQMTNKVWAEKIIKDEGVIFESKWGKALGIESTNDEAVHLAQKAGYKLVVRKDPKKNYIRIKTWPDPGIDLTDVYNKLRKADQSATWFLHASKHMILNGSTKNPEMKPTRLSLEEIINIIKNCL